MTQALEGLKSNAKADDSNFSNVTRFSVIFERIKKNIFTSEII